jgi:hypothetical protein
MRKKLQITVIFFACCLYTTSANILNVPGEYSTIQSAINAANTGDTVLVASGTYTENINFLGKNILVTSHYMFEENTSFITSTIIDGSQPIHPDTASCVLIISGEDSTAVLQGFTLTGGKGTKWLDEHGAGTYFEGGGILTTLSSPTIKNNLIINNEAIKSPAGTTSAGGGAIRCGDGSPRILNNIIVNNRGMYGGGIVLNYCSNALLSNNIITANHVFQAVPGKPTFGGGGVWILENLPGNNLPNILENNTITGNSSNDNGGGILIWSATVIVKSNIIWGNTAPTSGNQIKLRPGGIAEVTYCNVEGGWQGEGNIDTEPNFENDKLLLADGSLCIDAGDSDPQYNDPEGSPGMGLWPAKGTVRNDMGAYGGPQSAVLSDLSVTSVNNGGLNGLPQGFYLEQNYPNPFNPSTKIKYHIADAGFVNLGIYDVLGNEVVTLINKEMQAGNYEVEFQSATSNRQLASGIYMYKLKSGTFIETKKMVLMK